MKEEQNMQVRRCFIGQLEVDFEPCGMPSMWDLSSFSNPGLIGEYTFEIEDVELPLLVEDSIEVTQPLCQLVEYYERFVYQDFWNGCSD